MNRAAIAADVAAISTRPECRIPCQIPQANEANNSINIGFLLPNRQALQCGQGRSFDIAAREARRSLPMMTINECAQRLAVIKYGPDFASQVEDVCHEYKKQFFGDHVAVANAQDEIIRAAHGLPDFSAKGRLLDLLIGL